VPRGDVQQRVYAVVGGDGLVVVEVENRSPLPVAVVLSQRAMLSARAPTTVTARVDGVDLPPGASSYPLGHAAVIRLAVPLGSRPEPAVSLPPANDVAQGWRRRVAVGPGLVVPDDAMAMSLVTARCRALLDVPPSLVDDPAAAVVAASERHRLREPFELDGADIAAAAARVARAGRHGAPWTAAVALERAAELLDALGEARGANDARQVLRRTRVGPRDAEAPGGIWFGPWLERGLVCDDGSRIELLAGLPTEWFGQAVEAHDVPAGRGRVGVALRWHGARPALLWQCDAPRRVVCPRLDPVWATDLAQGEALLAMPR